LTGIMPRCPAQPPADRRGRSLRITFLSPHLSPVLLLAILLLAILLLLLLPILPQ
jgi:hypothetical protein